MPMEVWRFKLDGQAHVMSWHIYASAQKASWNSEVLVWFNPDRHAWVYGPKRHARGHENATVSFVIREGRSFDLAGNKLDGQRRNASPNDPPENLT